MSSMESCGKALGFVVAWNVYLGKLLNVGWGLFEVVLNECLDNLGDPLVGVMF